MSVRAQYNPGINFLERKREEWEDALLRAMNQAGVDVEADIMANQWGGRRADGKGLGIRTGNLYGSLSSAAEKLGKAVTSIVRNTGAKYWFWWDKSAYFAARDERTNVRERFETEGRIIYKTRVEDALQAVFG